MDFLAQEIEKAELKMAPKIGEKAKKSWHLVYDYEWCK